MWVHDDGYVFPQERHNGDWVRYEDVKDFVLNAISVALRKADDKAIVDANIIHDLHSTLAAVEDQKRRAIALQRDQTMRAETAEAELDAMRSLPSYGKADKLNVP